MNNNRARSLRQVRSSRSRSRSKRGVSPVIGVILMVAATIVIAGVVIGMLGGFKTPTRQYSVGVSVSENSTHSIILTFNGGPDSDIVDYLNVSINGTDVTAGLSPGNRFGAANGKSDVNVGNWTSYQVAADKSDRVIVTATFLDGTTQVILDTYV